MQQADTLDPVIDELYSSALAGTVAPATMLRLAGSAGFGAVSVVTERSLYTSPRCNLACGADAAAFRQALARFGAGSVMPRLRGREPLTGEFGFYDEFIPASELRRHPVYNEYMVPNGLEHGIKICLENSRERMLFGLLSRPERAGDRARQHAAMSVLAPHWARCTQVRLRLEELDVLHQAYSEGADMAPFPMIVFDNAGVLYLANRAAVVQLQGDGLVLQQQGVRAVRERENQRLQQALRAAIAASNGSGGGGGLEWTEFCVPRPSGLQSYRLIVAPLAAGHQREGRRPAALVMVFDPSGEFPVSLDRCREIFGLTRAEAEIAIGVMQGRSLVRIAQAQGRSVTTVRNLLKRVFHKTGTGRQSELTRLMLGSPLVLHAPSLVSADPETKLQ